MRHTANPLLDDQDTATATGPLSRWLSPLRRLTQAVRPRPRVDTRDSTELTTQAPPSRGQALRDAHRTLRQHLRDHPTLAQVMPHLAVLERKLAKHGSVALRRLPLPLLRRALVQLPLLQRDDESGLDAANLRVLRLRLMEAIAQRSASEQAGPIEPTLARQPRDAATTLGQADSGLPAVEITELAASAFDDHALDWSPANRQPPAH